MIAKTLTSWNDSKRVMSVGRAFANRRLAALRDEAGLAQVDVRVFGMVGVQPSLAVGEARPGLPSSRQSADVREAE
jgi:hypothetical protein